ncbi:MAG: LysM peptidoglycan-binding domain-containing M23 family metallopeptidase [Myxococcales bacterium]|nr:LysM peptidoglycan-binding domain-containing M23 family metallopeptidase [Myxococcales bacterium]MDH5308264.1 LysM peptidoglycan-binding domain-containing M23 family metallopeptidase [Myxococcales bacterium]
MSQQGAWSAAILALWLATSLAGLGCAGRQDSGVVHVVRQGETIYRLSRYYGVSTEDIVRANRIRDVSSVPVGTHLRIPGARRAPPRESLALVGPAPAAPALGDLAQREAGLEFSWPIRGKLSSGFGWRSSGQHEGIDISAKPGTSIRAAEAGRVILAGKLGGYGRVVIVKHAGRYSSVYAHNRRNRVQKGAFVEKGDVIAEVGASGNASGPHLHFEIRRDRKPEDPLQFLR